MRRFMPSITFITAVVCGTAAFAQSSQGTTPAKGPEKATAFVGCLEQSQRTAAPTSGAFILSTPTPSAAATAAKRGTPEDPANNARAAIPPIDAGDTGRAESKIASTFVLDGAATELAKHVGHKVEITGVLKAAAMTPETSPATGATPASTSVPHLQVTAIKMVAGTCSGN